jgi:hypothetical protein
MTTPTSRPRLFPETVPGGSLIGSVNSRFAASFTLYQSKHSFNGTNTVRSRAPTYSSDYDAQPCQSQPSVDADLVNIIHHLSRSKIETLVTQAWIRNIPNQSEEKLRDLVTGALKRGILSHDDIHSSCTNSFTSLPTHVSSLLTSS